MLKLGNRESGNPTNCCQCIWELVCERQTDGVSALWSGHIIAASLGHVPYCCFCTATDLLVQIGWARDRSLKRRPGELVMCLRELGELVTQRECWSVSALVLLSGNLMSSSLGDCEGDVCVQAERHLCGSGAPALNKD